MPNNTFPFLDEAARRSVLLVFRCNELSRGSRFFYPALSFLFTFYTCIYVFLFILQLHYGTERTKVRCRKGREKRWPTSRRERKPLTVYASGS